MDLKRHDWQINFSRIRHCDRFLYRFVFFRTTFWQTAGVISLKVSIMCPIRVQMYLWTFILSTLSLISTDKSVYVANSALSPCPNPRERWTRVTGDPIVKTLKFHKIYLPWAAMLWQIFYFCLPLFFALYFKILKKSSRWVSSFFFFLFFRQALPILLLKDSVDRSLNHQSSGSETWDLSARPIYHNVESIFSFLYGAKSMLVLSRQSCYYNNQQNVPLFHIKIWYKEAFTTMKASFHRNQQK